MVGTLINVATVVTGGATGTVLGGRLPPKVRETVMHGLGLVTILIGLQKALGTRDILVLLGSLVVGGIAGELMRLEEGLEGLGRRLERAVGPSNHRASHRFVQGFVTASLVFCVGPLAILGSIEDGLTGDFRTLALKSMLDGFAALAFASTLGMGVTFAALTVLFYQGALTLSAAWAKAFITEAMIAEMTAAGGLVIAAIGLSLLEIKRLRLANLLPAIFIAPLAVALRVSLWGPP